MPMLRQFRLDVRRSDPQPTSATATNRAPGAWAITSIVSSETVPGRILPPVACRCDGRRSPARLKASIGASVTARRQPPPLPCPAEPEQRLGLAPQVSFVTRAADLDVSDACIPAAIGEPGAAEPTSSQDIGLNRSCSRSFRGRQPRERASATDGRIASGNVGATRFQPPVFLFSYLPARSSSSDRDRATEIVQPTCCTK